VDGHQGWGGQHGANDQGHPSTQPPRTTGGPAPAASEPDQPLPGDHQSPPPYPALDGRADFSLQYMSPDPGETTAPLAERPTATPPIESMETARLTAPPISSIETDRLTAPPIATANVARLTTPPLAGDGAARHTAPPTTVADYDVARSPYPVYQQPYTRPTAPPVPRSYDSAPPDIRRGAPASRQLSPKRARGWRGRALLIALVLVCFLLGYGGIYAAITVPDALAAARDAKAQAAALQNIIAGGHLTDVATLTAIQARLRALDNDLSRIQSDFPGGPATGVVSASAPGHALAMARDLTTTGLYAVDAGLTLAPHIKDFMSSVTGSSASKTGSASGVAPGPLTTAEIDRASVDVRAAAQFAASALAERAHVGDGDLRTLGLGSLVGPLHKLDAVAPKLPTYLDYAQRILAAAPGLLGVGAKPANFLVLDLDSDELRGSGGFQGVYGIVTLKGARLSGGMHLKNVYALDCPNGFGSDCVNKVLPSTYNWFPYHDGLRNANLDPNYPTTARLDERMLALDHTPPVAGVISLTPVIIRQALTLTGAVAVPGYPQKITAQNFSELIHYYHSIGGAFNLNTVKAFDAAAGAALLKAVGHLSQADQSALMKIGLGDLQTGDLQIYFNDPRVESVLSALQVDGALRTPAGDTYELVNINHGANYANVDVTAVQADHVVINAQGAATHTLTISYNFPIKSHIYTSSLVSVYRGFVEVLAPSHARLQSIRGCARVTITEPGWADFACNLTLFRGQKATVVFQWTTPGVTVTATNGAIQYDLLVQRQSGTANEQIVVVSPPAGARIAQPLVPGLSLIAGGQARFEALLNKDRAVSLTWTR
jgi:hypothetical protein